MKAEVHQKRPNRLSLLSLLGGITGSVSGVAVLAEAAARISEAIADCYLTEPAELGPTEPASLSLSRVVRRLGKVVDGGLVDGSGFTPAPGKRCRTGPRAASRGAGTRSRRVEDDRELAAAGIGQPLVLAGLADIEAAGKHWALG